MLTVKCVYGPSFRDPPARLSRRPETYCASVDEIGGVEADRSKSLRERSRQVFAVGSQMGDSWEDQAEASAPATNKQGFSFNPTATSFSFNPTASSFKPPGDEPAAQPSPPEAPVADASQPEEVPGTSIAQPQSVRSTRNVEARHCSSGIALCNIINSCVPGRSAEILDLAAGV